MSNIKITFYIIGFFILIILSAVGASVYVLHREQVIKGTLDSNISQEPFLTEENPIQNPNPNSDLPDIVSEKATSTSATQDNTVTQSNTVINTLSQISKHNTESDCWLIISNKIYDVSSFLNLHSGGSAVIVPYCGKDATDAFKTHGMSGGSNHSAYAYSLLPTYYVGIPNTVVSTPSTAVSTSTTQIKTTTVVTKSVTPTTTLTPSSKFSLGDRVKTTSNLNIRNTANTSGTLLGTRKLGDTGTVSSGPIYSNLFWWWNVNFDSGVDGWAVENYLQKYIAPIISVVQTPVISNPVVTQTSSDITTSQVATHNTQSNCWLIILDKVYNVTSFMSSHPGGISTISTRCGTDATTVFTTSAGHTHTSYAYSLLPTYYVGDVGVASTPTPTPDSDTIAPTTPTGLSAAAISSSQINLSWTASTDTVGVTGYKIYRGGVQIGTSSNIGYSDIGLPESSVYSYTVSAYDAAGNTSSQSTSKSATTNSVVVTDTTAPSTPTGLSATAISSSQINLSWTASTDTVGVTGYKIYRGGVQIGTSASTNYSNTGLSTNTTYSYTVSAYDAAGNTSSQSTSKSATTNLASATTYTTSQVATHNTQSDCWLIILNKVYNVTSFMNSHPGGVSTIRTRCGTDATTVFTTSAGAGHTHSSYAYSLLPTYYVGDVVQ